MIDAPTNPGEVNASADMKVAVLMTATFVALVPFVADPEGWFVYLPARWLFLVAGTGALLAALTACGRSPRAPSGAAAWVALITVASAAALVSSGSRISVLGASDRLFGATTWLLHGSLAVLGATVVRSRADLSRLARAMCVAMLGVATVTLAQRGGWSWPAGASSPTRPGGPFGNANFLGAYAVLATVVAAGVSLDRGERAAWRTLGAAAATAGVAVAVLSGSRSSWLALSGAGVALAVAVTHRRTRVAAATPDGDAPRADAPGADATRRRVRSGAVASVLLALGFAVAIGALAGRSDRFDGLTEGTARGRVDTWAVAVGVLSERPVLGWGPEGFAEGAARSIDDGWERRYTRRLTPDRAHNGLLDVATTIGLLGATAYAVVLVATGRRLRMAARDARCGDGSAPDTTVLGVVVGLVAYLAHQQLLFPLPDVDGLAWLLAGAVGSLALPVDRSSASLPRWSPRPRWSPLPRWSARPRWSPRVLGNRAVAERQPGSRESNGHLPSAARAAGALAAVAVWVALVVVGTRGVVADRHARSAADALDRGEGTALNSAIASLDASPGQVLPALLAADAARSIGTEAALREGLAAVERTRVVGFDDGRLTFAAARLELALGTPADVRDATDRIDAWLALDPARSEAWILLGDAHAAAGDDPAAIAAWERAVTLAPRRIDILERLAFAHDRAGSPDRAVAAIRRIEQLRGPDAPPLQLELALLRARLDAAGR